MNLHYLKSFAKRKLNNLFKKYFQELSHFIGKLTKNYYFEDFVRVYPNGMAFNKFGIIKKSSTDDYKNFLNHSKFYIFASQFVKGKIVADLGCGSGYGCKILKKGGAIRVLGSDISKKAIKFAKKYYSSYAEFTIQKVTDMKKYSTNLFDIATCNEVLEHLKEYNKENDTLKEIKRITKKGGLLIIGTPNKEMLNQHGFSFNEIINLFQSHFSQYCIFENALVPFGANRLKWEKRLGENKIGIIISENINLSETVLFDNKQIELKKGLETGIYKFSIYNIKTDLLHNTHSWIVLAINNK